MDSSDEVVKTVEDAESTIVAAVQALDTQVEGLYDVIANIPSEDISPSAKLKIETAIGAMKTNVLAGIEKAATDDPESTTTDEG